MKVLYLFSTAGRYRFVSSTTTLDNKSKPIRFGNAISPFIISAKVQTISNSTTAPNNTTNVKTAL